MNARVVHLGQLLQGPVAAMMKRPPPDCLADGLQRLWARGGQEAVRVDVTWPHRFPRSEIEAEKVERLVRKISTPVRILAVDDLRLLGTGCRPQYLLPVKVLSRLFRRLMLEMLLAAHDAGRLQFYGGHRIYFL